MALLVSASAGGGAGGTTSGIDATGGSLVITYGVSDSGVPAISDSAGNTASHLTTIGGSFPTFHRGRISYFENPASLGAGYTTTSAGTNASHVAAVFDGTLTASVFDVEAGAQVLGATTAQGGSVTPSSGLSLVISAIGFESGSVSLSIDSSFTIIITQNHVGGVSYGSAIAYKFSSSIENPTWTLGGTFDVTVRNAVFKLAAAPAAGGPKVFGGAVAGRRRFRLAA